MSTPSNPAYRERLTLPWWLWIFALGLAVALAAQLHLGADGVREWLPYALIVPATIVGAIWLGRITVCVEENELRVDDARLPVHHISTIEALDGPARRDVLGVYAHPLAFVIQRPWIKGTVLVALADPADPTPYWVISTRHPERLIAAVTATQSVTEGDGPAGSEGPAAYFEDSAATRTEAPRRVSGSSAG